MHAVRSLAGVILIDEVDLVSKLFVYLGMLRTEHNFPLISARTLPALLGADCPCTDSRRNVGNKRAEGLDATAGSDGQRINTHAFSILF